MYGYYSWSGGENATGRDMLSNRAVKLGVTSRHRFQVSQYLQVGYR
jgi:hypothetical protein